MSSRKGISLTISPAVIVSPAGSCTMSTSGGWCQPVSIGDTRRASMPDGAIRKASPKATAACGTDSSGDTRCWMRAKMRVADQPAMNSMTVPSEMAVAAKPVPRLIATDIQMPGSARTAAKGARLKEEPPSAGK